MAESSIGGLLSASLLAIPGASEYFMGGAVLYTIRARRELLGLTKETLDSQEPLTESYATLLADAARHRLQSDWAIAEIGATGPTGSRYGHPPGICALAVTGPKIFSRCFETDSNDREDNMNVFLNEALNLLRTALSE